jgi:hypothetical protein
VIRALLRFIFASPLRAAIICGLLIAVGFGYITYPDPELRKSVTDWRLQDAFVTGQDAQRVLGVLNASDGGSGEVVRLSEEEFRARGLRYTIGFPVEEDSARRFLIRYAGMENLNDERVYLAEREIFAAPWWSPHRFVYKAAAAEVGAISEVLDLTFERDVLGLVGLLLFDGVLGLIYGFVIGLIVAVLRGAGLAQAPAKREALHGPIMSRGEGGRTRPAAARRG